jgi:hypothetical protein
MGLLLNIAILAFIVAQFTPRGRVFLSTERGALVTVAVAAVAILMMLPSALMGNLISIVFTGIWAYVAYPRLGDASRGAKRMLRLPR